MNPRILEADDDEVEFSFVSRLRVPRLITNTEPQLC